MRARTITTIVVLGALAIPVSASAQADSDYSSANSITGGSSESSQPVGSQDLSSGYSSLNATAGPPSSEPTPVSGSPASADDGFDWFSGGIGAAAAMALVALGGVAFLTVHRRTTVSPSTASIS